jgi:hypothetical protein
MSDDLGPLQRYPTRRDRPPPRRELPRAAGLRARALRLTPGRALVVVAVVGAFAFIGYGLVRRDSAQIPILAAGLIILGLTLVGAGFWSALTAYRDARAGRSGAAFVGALIGGLCVFAGTGALASALVLSLIWRSA